MEVRFVNQRFPQIYRAIYIEKYSQMDVQIFPSVQRRSRSALEIQYTTSQLGETWFQVEFFFEREYIHYSVYCTFQSVT